MLKLFFWALVFIAFSLLRLQDIGCSRVNAGFLKIVMVHRRQNDWHDKEAGIPRRVEVLR